MTQAFSEKRSSGEFRKPKKGLADKIAADPTSVFLAALRHSHPDALKALAVWCKKQESQDLQTDESKPAKKHDQSSVLQAMEGLKRVGSATASRLSAIKKEDENLIELESLTQPPHVSTSLDETADYPTIAYAQMEASVARELIEEKAQAAAAAYSASLDETSEYAAIPFSAKDFTKFAGDPLPDAIEAHEQAKQEEKRKLAEAQEKLRQDNELLEAKQHRLEELEKLEARKKAEEEIRKLEDREFEEKRQLEAKRKSEEEEKILAEKLSEEMRLREENEQRELEEKRRIEQKQKRLEEKQKQEEEKRLKSKKQLESETSEERKKREDLERLEAKKKRQEKEELEARQKLEELERIQARQRIEEQEKLEIQKKQEEQEKLEARKKRDEREKLEIERKQKEKEEREKLEAEKIALEQEKLAAKRKIEEEEKREAARLLEENARLKKPTGEIDHASEAVVISDFSLPVDEALDLFGTDRLIDSLNSSDSKEGRLDFSVVDSKAGDETQNEISSSQPSIKAEILAAFDIPIPTDDVDVSQSPEVEEGPGVKSAIPLRSVTKGPAKPQRIEPSGRNTQQNIDAIPKPIGTEGFLEEELQEEYQGVYEQVTQRGGVFDAKSRDSFSGNSEKKIRTTYIGLKAISKEEAEAAQEDAVQKQKKTQEVRALLTPSAPIGEKLNSAAKSVKKVNKTPFIIAASLLLIGGLTFLVTNLGRGETSLKDGEKLFAEKKYEEAAKVFSEAVQLNPVSAHSYFMRARAYNKLGDSEKAIADFTSCLKINPTYAEALDHRSSVFMRLGKYDEALNDYKTLFGSTKEAPKLYQLNNAALACRQLEKFGEASIYYDKALKLEPKDKDALLGRALSETGQKQFSKAVEQCDKMIAIYPDDLEIYVTRGWCYVQLKQNAAALKDFDFVLRKDPKNAKASLNRGHLYNQMGKTDLAIRDYEVASTSDPTLVEARSARAWALMHSKPGVALNDLKMVTASSQFKESTDFWKARAELEMNAKKYAVSAASFEKAIALSETPNASLNVGAAKAYNALKKYDKAVESCNKAISIEPNNAMAFAVRGYAHDGSNNAISAVSDYAQEIQLNNRMPEPYLFRAQHYFKDKKYLAAQTDLKAVLALNANNADAKKFLATVNAKIPRSSASYAEVEKAPDRRYAKIPFDQLVTNGYAELNKGKTETAVAMLTEAVRQNPSDFTARRYLCHALVRENPAECVRQFDAMRSSGQLNSDDESCYSVALSFAATGNTTEAGSIKKAITTLANSPGNSAACYKLATMYFGARMPSKAQALLQQGIGSAGSKAEEQRFQELNQKINKHTAQPEAREDIGG